MRPLLIFYHFGVSRQVSFGWPCFCFWKYIDTILTCGSCMALLAYKTCISYSTYIPDHWSESIVENNSRLLQSSSIIFLFFLSTHEYRPTPNPLHPTTQTTLHHHPNTQFYQGTTMRLQHGCITINVILIYCIKSSWPLWEIRASTMVLYLTVFYYLLNVVSHHEIPALLSSQLVFGHPCICKESSVS